MSELLTLVGSLLFAGTPQESITGIVGGIVALLAIGLAIYRHEGTEMIFTLVRKALSITPAILLQLNVIDTGTATKLIAAIAPLSALVWSYLVNAGLAKGSIPDNVTKLIIIGTIVTLTLPSCGLKFRVGLDEDVDSGGVRSPITGLKYRKAEDGGAKAVIDIHTITSNLQKAVQIINGADPKTVLIPNYPKKDVAIPIEAVK